MAPLRRAFPLSLRAYAWLIAVLFLAICALTISRLDSHAGSKRRVGGPNVVIIQTDDQTLTSLNRRTMPNVHRLLADRGVTFTDHIVASPLCCPSRASLLTGQYPHNHGVRSNPDGYEKLEEKRNTLPAWLARAGYRTAHVGKFLNNYERFALTPSAPAPGWHDWVTMLKPYGYFDYELAVDGRVKGYGSGKSEYLSTVLNRWAVRLIRDSAGERPFFLALDHFAPHGQSRAVKGGCGRTALPLPGDFRRFAREALPSPPSFAEEDLSDKPSFRQDDRLSAARIRGIRRNYRCRVASLRAVDRGVKRIVKELRSSGELDETVIVFTSDNGFLQGEHAIPAQKAQAYEEAIRVPLVIRTPATARREPTRIEAPTANIDLAPTILELAGTKPCRSASDCRTMDGRSLVPLLARAPSSLGRGPGAAHDVHQRPSPKLAEGELRVRSNADARGRLRRAPRGSRS